MNKLLICIVVCLYGLLHTQYELSASDLSCWENNVINKLNSSENNKSELKKLKKLTSNTVVRIVTWIGEFPDDCESQSELIDDYLNRAAIIWIASLNNSESLLIDYHDSQIDCDTILTSNFHVNDSFFNMPNTDVTINCSSLPFVHTIVSIWIDSISTNVAIPGLWECSFSGKSDGSIVNTIDDGFLKTMFRLMFLCKDLRLKCESFPE